MKYSELVESIPHSNYGYWISPIGKVYPVSAMDGHDVVYDWRPVDLPGNDEVENPRYKTHYNEGWIRVSVTPPDYADIESNFFNTSTFSVTLDKNSKSVLAMKGLFRLAKSFKDFEKFTVSYDIDEDKWSYADHKSFDNLNNFMHYIKK